MPKKAHSIGIGPDVREEELHDLTRKWFNQYER
jgi:hypothetical protein